MGDVVHESGCVKVDMELPKIPKPQPRPKGATEKLGAGQPIPNH